MREESYRDVSNCLRKYRRARGLKQIQVANLLGLKSTAMISRWEKGDCFPEWINVIKLSVIYRTMPDALFVDHVRLIRADILKKEEGILMTN